jgi:uncharacterized protein (DUF58 family)
VSAVQPLAPPARSAAASVYGKLPYAFGDRFFVLLVAGLLWIGFLFWSHRFLVGLLLWNAGLAAAWLADLRAIPSRGKLVIERSFTSALALGESSAIRLQVVNQGRRPLHVQLIDDVPVKLRESPAPLYIQVPDGQERATEYRIGPLERGDCKFGPVYLRVQTQFALAQKWERADLQQEVRVYPSLKSARKNQLFLARSRQIELDRRLLRQQGQGREFEYLREYREGDEARDICWTATARRGKAVTRVHRAERNQAIWIVIDCGRLMRSRLDNMSKLDFAVDAALNLSQVASFGGDRIGLLAYGQKIQQRHMPGRGPSHTRAMLDQLSQLQEEGGEADHLRAAAVLMSMQTRRSLIVWITDFAESAMTPEVVQAAIQMSGRHVVLFVAIGQPDLRRLAAELPRNPAELYRYTAAIETLERREALLARMHERGAWAMEVEANRISTTVMNKYLELKERGQL